jgi:hypothetical protein
VGDELVTGLERAPQVVLDLKALGGVAAHDGVEQLEAPAAVLLGAVHRGIGLADEVLRGPGQVSGDRDPDARGDELLGRAELERPAQCFGHALGDADRQLGLREVVADHAELVAAEARDRVTGAQHVGEPRGQHAQQLIPGAVPERVVDELEAVEVEEEDGGRRSASSAVVQGERETIHEQRAIRQPGERVVQRLALDLLLGAATLYGVGEHVRGGLQEGDLVRSEPGRSQDAHRAEGGVVWADGHVQALDRAPARAEHAAVRRRVDGRAELGVEHGASHAYGFVQEAAEVLALQRQAPEARHRGLLGEVALEFRLGAGQALAGAVERLGGAPDLVLHEVEGVRHRTDLVERTSTWTMSTRALAASRSPVLSARIARVRSATVPLARRAAASEICSTACAMIPGRTRPTVIVRMATATKMSCSREMSAGWPASTELTARR